MPVSLERLNQLLTEFGVNQLNVKILRAFVGTSAPHAPAVAAKVVAKITSTPSLFGLFAGPAEIQMMAETQVAYCLALFNGRFDADYLTSLHAMVEAHQLPGWYLGCYEVIVQEFKQIARNAFRAGWKTKARQAVLVDIINAIDHVLMLDMQISMMLYFAMQKSMIHNDILMPVADFEHAASDGYGSIESNTELMQASAGEALRHVADAIDEIQTAIFYAGDASVSVEAVASAVEELTRSIAQIGGQVNEAALVSEESMAGSNAIIEAVSSLANGVNSISEVVALITNIASQTNLLALNATIEAARAGDVGKGFAVVAGEVKILANQTAAASEVIQRRISDIKNSTQKVEGSILGLGQVIQGNRDIFLHISRSIAEQTIATNVIARDLSETLIAAEATNASTRVLSGNAVAARNKINLSLEASDDVAIKMGGLKVEFQRLVVQVLGESHQIT